MSNHDLILLVPAPARLWRERLGSAMPLTGARPLACGELRLRLRVQRLDALHLALEFFAAATYGFVGLDNYASLWANRRWNIAYNNLFSSAVSTSSARWPWDCCWRS